MLNLVLKQKFQHDTHFLATSTVRVLEPQLESTVHLTKPTHSVGKYSSYKYFILPHVFVNTLMARRQNIPGVLVSSNEFYNNLSLTATPPETIHFLRMKRVETVKVKSSHFLTLRTHHLGINMTPSCCCSLMGGCFFTPPLTTLLRFIPLPPASSP